MKAINTLKASGWKVSKAGNRFCADGRSRPCLLIQNALGLGLTIGGDKRQIGRQMREIAREFTK